MAVTPIKIPGTDIQLELSEVGQTGDGTGPIFETTGVGVEEDPDLWLSAQLGDLGFLKPFFKAAKKALELHKANSAFIKEIYELNKALMFATIDPIFAAIDAILDEILKILKDLRGLGFYMLQVHAGSVEPNVERNPMTGALFFGQNVYVPAARQPPVLKPGTDPPEYRPGKLVPAGDTDKIALDPISGEQNYVEQPAMSDTPLSTLASLKGFESGNISGRINKAYIKVNKYTGLTALTPGGILQTIDKSFDDLGDVPKFFKQAIADGEDTAGGLADYVPNVDISKFSDLIDPSYYKSGRPIMSDSAKVGGIIFIMGMPDFNKFSNVLRNFNKILDISGLVELEKSIKKLWEPAAVTHRLLVSKVAAITITEGSAGTFSTERGGVSEGVGAERDAASGDDRPSFYIMQDETSGTFRKQDPEKTNRILKNNKGVFARVKRVIESKEWLNEVIEMNAAKAMDSVDVDMTESRIKLKHIGTKVNRNPLPYMNQTLEIEYLESGAEEFQAGELIYEAVPAVGSKIHAVQSGASAEDLVLEPDDQRENMYHQVKDGTCVVGMVVDAYDDNALPEAPNWTGKTLEQLIPALGPLLNKCEAEVKGIKSSVASAKKTLDPIIEWLDSKIEDVLAFAKDIEEIIDLFANGLPATGMYSLYLEPRMGGITKFRERMMGAGGEKKPPEDLKFCAGVCFLGGGPDNSVLLRGIDMLSLLLGLRKQTADEVVIGEKMDSISTEKYDGPPDGNKVYEVDDKVSFGALNFICIKKTVSEDTSAVFKPVILSEDGLTAITNSAYWQKEGGLIGSDEEVTVGDPRTALQITEAKINWLKAAKIALGLILDDLAGSPPSGDNLTDLIMAVNLFGSYHPITGEFEGEDIDIYIEMKQLRDNDLRELELLVLRITEMLQAIEINLIQESLKLEKDEDLPKGSLRSKGKTLMIIKGEFVDEVDGTSFEDFGHRKVKRNTTITILHPLLESSGSTRSVERLSNTTIAILDEEFPVDIDEALSYNIALDNSYSFEPYSSAPENKIANTNKFKHPGYRLREYKAKANTISIAVPNSAGEYPQLPVWESGQAGPEGDVRTTANYPEGTVIKINGTVPVSESYISDDTGLLIVRTEEEQAVADTWMALGVSENDAITVEFGSDTGGSQTKIVDSTIGEEHIKVDGAFFVGKGGAEMFQYHEEWSFKISDQTAAQLAKTTKLQSSRNLFQKYLEEIAEKAEDVYEYLNVFESETWPKVGDDSS
jgi:hypothetical protein